MNKGRAHKYPQAKTIQVMLENLDIVASTNHPTHMRGEDKSERTRAGRYMSYEEIVQLMISVYPRYHDGRRYIDGSDDDDAVLDLPSKDPEPDHYMQRGRAPITEKEFDAAKAVFDTHRKIATERLLWNKKN